MDFGVTKSEPGEATWAFIFAVSIPETFGACYSPSRGRKAESFQYYLIDQPITSTGASLLGDLTFSINKMAMTAEDGPGVTSQPSGAVN